MIETAKEALAKYGIALTFNDQGFPELTSRRGVQCVYSDRNFVPVVAMDADGRFEISWIDAGKAELRIVGRTIGFSSKDAAFRNRVND